MKIDASAARDKASPLRKSAAIAADSEDNRRLRRNRYRAQPADDATDSCPVVVKQPASNPVEVFIDFV